jgi:hypothetical protein
MFATSHPDLVAHLGLLALLREILAADGRLEGGPGSGEGLPGGYDRAVRRLRLHGSLNRDPVTQGAGAHHSTNKARYGQSSRSERESIDTFWPTTASSRFS